VLPAEDARKPVVQEQARLLGALSIEPRNPHYRLDAARLGPAREGFASRLEPYVALHPFAGEPRRCVSMSGWIEVAQSLQSRGSRILWIGTVNELERLRAASTRPPGFFIDQLGDGSLATTAAALSLATLFVGQPERTFPQGAGASRMIYSPTPDAITADRILREIDALLVSSAP
jgi:ADP-heptose:LPS heptosyltransferase